LLQGLDEVLSPWLTNGGALGTLLACIAYAALVGGVRWFMMARPARKLLIARIEGDLAASAERTEEESAALTEAKNLLSKAKADLASGAWATLGWSGADEVSGWRHVFAAERTLLWVWPADRVRVRLLDTRDRILELLGPAAENLGLVQAIDAEEKASPPNDTRSRALLDEALCLVRDTESEKLFTLHTWQNKSMLLVGIGLLLIAIIAATIGKPSLLLVGAIGGFLSRLGKILKSDRVPSGYGASWTTIFLSPLLGALSGWAGILLANLALQLGLLGQSLQFIGWTSNWGNPGTLGLAFLLGFSERYLNDMATNVESATVPTRELASKALRRGESAPTSPVPANNTPAQAETPSATTPPAIAPSAAAPPVLESASPAPTAALPPNPANPQGSLAT